MPSKFIYKLENKEDYEFFVSDTYDHDLDYQWSISGEFEKASYELVLYSNADKTIAKGNKFIMGLTQFHSYEYWQKFENDYYAKKIKFNMSSNCVFLLKQA